MAIIAINQTGSRGDSFLKKFLCCGLILMALIFLKLTGTELYEQDVWGDSDARQIALDKLIMFEKMPEDVKFLENAGVESYLTLIGEEHVILIKKGLNLCEELNNVSMVIRLLSKLKI